jgi:hypothetical protein
MAKVDLDILLSKLQGRLSGDSKFYAMHRHGRTVISNYPKHKDPKVISAQQKANSSAFAQVSKQAKLELSDPSRQAYWQEQYDQYQRLADKNLKKTNTRFFGPDSPAGIRDKRYTTLRGFLIAQLSNRPAPEPPTQE